MHAFHRLLAAAAGLMLLPTQAAAGGTWGLAQEPLSAMLLGWSAVAAVLTSLFITMMHKVENTDVRTIWIAASLAGMGVMDGFNAASSLPLSEIWLHSLAALVGGLLFALVILPESLSQIAIFEWLPCMTAAACAVPGLTFMLVPDILPETSSAALVMSWAGGIGFLYASLFFFLQKQQKGRPARRLLAGCSLFFALTAFFFPFLQPHSPVWQLWQALRLAALFVLFDFFFRNSRDTVSKLRRSRDEQSAAHRLLADLIENAPAAVTMKDLSGRFLLVNKRFEELFGIKKQEAVGRAAGELLPCLTRRLQESRSDTAAEYEESMALQNGVRTFSTSCFTLSPDAENRCCVGCMQTDITDRKQLEHQLRLDEKIIENTEEAVVITDSEAMILDVNDAYTEITGYTRQEAVGQNPRFCQSGRHDQLFYKEMWRQLSENGFWSGAIWDRRKHGEIFEKWLTINAIRDSGGATVSYVGVFTDITEKKNAERKLRNLLFYDSLTKLPNRTLFQERLEQALLNSQDRDMPLALFCIDLDRFKDINDTLGHKAGDELLVQAAKRIRNGLRKSDIVARLCGDEFCVILSEIKLRESVGLLAMRLIHLLQQPFYIADQEVFIDASIGISIYPDDAKTADSLLKNADTAMHFAKEQARGSFQHFRSQMNERLLQRLNLEHDLRHALEQEEFLLHYQPKYSLVEDRIVGAEALVRWHHPKEGMISPEEFIPVAEASSMIIALGKWVLRTACRQVKTWEEEGLGQLRIAVNLSSKQFQDRKLLQFIKATLEETALAAEQLELEITESTVMEQPLQTAELLREIRDMGVRIAIDDFGTGYSSLAYLKKFPVNTLKIDQSFVADLTKDSEDQAIVDSIIRMAAGLKLDVVAEGVETQEQLDFFKQRQCKEVQGYFFSKPLSAEAFAEKIRASLI
ncbi:PAS domain S-box-containing protein/diguanylate cyclase (GGDEF) domain-containing protein [Candidatus Electronema halotolerans]